MPRRASAQITLVLIGSAATVGCAPEAPPQAIRDHYASAADCAVDWGAPEHCERVQDSSGGGVFFYRGPTYFPGTRPQLQESIRGFAGKPGQPPSNLAIGRSAAPSVGTTARGGFGSSSRSFSVGS